MAWVTARVTAQLLLATGLGLAAMPASAVDVNSATAQQLESVSGIGPRTAEIIVQERERAGAFESFDDLAERVRGIGQKKAKALQAAGLTVGGEGAAVQAGAGKETVNGASAAATAQPATVPPAKAQPASKARQ